jgi:hypothetical protein
MTTTTRTIERLNEIRIEIKELILESMDLIGSECEFELKRAEGYWASQMLMALDEDHSYLGGCMVTMDDTINNLSETEEDEE